MSILVTRLAWSTIGSYQLRANNAYLLSNWAIPSASFAWKAALLDTVRAVQRVSALDKSAGDFGTTFDIVWFRLSPNMLSQLRADFGSKDFVDITIEVYHQWSGLTVYNGRMEWMRDGEYEQRHPNFANVINHVHRLVVAPYGRSFSASFSASFG
jgi:hypothetical protein